MNDIMQTQKKHILIVEDEKSLLALYAQLLKDEGFEVDIAADGEAGLAAVLRGGYDLILLDIILPKIDGLNILQKLKNEKPQVPNGSIVIMSNLNQDMTISQGVSLGVRGYIIKSDYTPEQFVNEVKGYLEKDSPEKS